MSFQLEERRVSEDGYAYTKTEFQSHYHNIEQWNLAHVETRYDRDGNTYTQRAFFEHYGNLDHWYAAIPANAYSDVNKPPTSSINNNGAHSTSSSTHSHSFPEITPGWSSDRGPQAPDDGFFDTQGYGDHYHSYDDMAYSSNLYGHWSSSSQGGSSSSRRPSTSASGSIHSQPSSGRRRRSTDAGRRGPAPSMRSRSNSGASLSSGAASSSSSSSFSSPSPQRQRSSRVERSLSTLGRKLFDHIPPKQLKIMVSPSSPKASRRKNSRRKEPLSSSSLSDVAAGGGGAGGGAGGSGGGNSLTGMSKSIYDRRTNLRKGRGRDRDQDTGSGGEGQQNKQQQQLARENRTGGNATTPASSSLSTNLITTPLSNMSNMSTPPKSTRTFNLGSSNKKNTSPLSPQSGPKIDIGDYISVKCNVTSHFRLCRVLDMRDGTPPTVHVHFEGTPSVPDEFLAFDSNRLAPFDRSQDSPKHGSSKKVLVAKSKFVNVGDYVEVRMFYQDPDTKRGDFRFQMAQIVSSDASDGSIRVHFEGLPIPVEDEIIPMSDVPLRVRAMGNGVSSLSPDKKNLTSLSSSSNVTSSTSAAEADVDLNDSPTAGSSLSSADTNVTSVETTAAASLDNSSSSSSDDEGDAPQKKPPQGKNAPRRMKSSKSELSKALKKMGLRIIKIAADGNCLFRAVAHQLYVDVTRHIDLRKECCEYMLVHRTHFCNFVDGSFDEYIEKMKQETTWGGNLEITAMSEMCDRKITIHSKDDVKEMEERIAEKKKKNKIEKALATTPASSSSLLASASTSIRTVPALVLKHDFDTSLHCNVATPRPSGEKTPDAILLSYHGQSHYNSVVDPQTPLPLAPLSTTYIRQGRVLRETANENSTVASTLSASAAAVANEEKKKKKKENRRAFFRFRGSKSSSSKAASGLPPTDLPPVMTTGGVNSGSSGSGAGAGGTKTTPRLKPMKSAPDLNLTNNSNTVIVGDGRAKGRQERQRPSLPSLPSHPSSSTTERRTIPTTDQKAVEQSSRIKHDFMNKADALLKANMEQLNARIANKVRRDTNDK